MGLAISAGISTPGMCASLAYVLGHLKACEKGISLELMHMRGQIVLLLTTQSGLSLQSCKDEQLEL